MTTAVTTPVVGASILVVVVACCIVLTVHHLLAHRRQLAMARAEWLRPRRSTTATVDIWKQRAEVAEGAIASYRRETFLAVRRSEELARQLEAARLIGRRQERDRLALATLAIEREQTAQMPAIPEQTGTAAPGWLSGNVHRLDDRRPA